jgi:hypothetical protein
MFHEDLAVHNGGVVASSALHVAACPTGKIMYVFGSRECQLVEVDDVNIGVGAFD